MGRASAVELELLGLINTEREDRDLDPLKLEVTLNDAGEAHSEWMLSTDTFSHAGTGGSSHHNRMIDAGFTFSGSWRSGENIGYQSERGAAGISDDVADIHHSLMDSPGHRANILNPDFDYVGLGVEYGDFRSHDAVMVTQVFAATSAPVRLDPGMQSPDGGGAGEVDNEIVGTPGTDMVDGGVADEILRGQAGNDTLEGGPGADTLSGGPGQDIANYVNAAVGVEAGLKAPDRNTGEAAGDTYSSIEGLRGSRQDDILRGDGGANWLQGLDGDDRLLGRAGADTLIGGHGDDRLEGQFGNDTLFGNGGDDRFVFRDGGGRDLVRDFQDDHDVLDFAGMDFSSKSELVDAAYRWGNSVVFDFGDGNLVQVENTTLSSLIDDILV